MTSDGAGHAARERDRALALRRSVVTWVGIASGAGVIGFAGLAAITDAGAATASSPDQAPPAPADAPAGFGTTAGDQADPSQGSFGIPSRPGRVAFGRQPSAVSGGS
ncbi:MAG TPA: hypothetical protein VFO60_07935 [Candidatus Dormibacteraeota bacterium]|nr:hypothetical protein [Candidatus Dormibacteraeota bacterium]